MFYEKLQKELKDRNTNLNQLAKTVGINQSATSRYKSGGMPNTEVLVKICQYLNVSADYLLDLDEEAPPPKLSDQEEKLLDHFRQCDAGTQKSILMLASSGAAEAESKETSLNSKNAG
jgi:transcriptional regulator with XRE-family HTH domain